MKAYEQIVENSKLEAQDPKAELVLDHRPRARYVLRLSLGHKGLSWRV